MSVDRKPEQLHIILPEKSTNFPLYTNPIEKIVAQIMASPNKKEESKEIKEGSKPKIYVDPVTGLRLTRRIDDPGY